MDAVSVLHSPHSDALRKLIRGELALAETWNAPRDEFQALKRLGDYEELRDGTLVRVDGDTEFRIYRELVSLARMDPDDRKRT